MWEYPNSPEPEYPYAASIKCALGLVLSQADHNFFRQNSQLPQAIVKGTTTRSPRRRFVTHPLRHVHLLGEAGSLQTEEQIIPMKPTAQKTALLIFWMAIACSCAAAQQDHKSWSDYGGGPEYVCAGQMI